MLPCARHWPISANRPRWELSFVPKDVGSTGFCEGATGKAAHALIKAQCQLKERERQLKECGVARAMELANNGVTQQGIFQAQVGAVQYFATLVSLDLLSVETAGIV